jgi:hypothetical protein
LKPKKEIPRLSNGGFGFSGFFFFVYAGIPQTPLRRRIRMFEMEVFVMDDWDMVRNALRHKDDRRMERSSSPRSC